MKHSAVGIALIWSLVAATSGAQTAAWWPAHGSVILGGGRLEERTRDSFARRLIALSGGSDAQIVIIPTANEGVAPVTRAGVAPFDPKVLVQELTSRGATRVTILNTRDRAVADSEAFVAPLRTARGVWIPGGGARILEPIYRGTRVERELRGVLDRGGVVAGDSAGAIAIGSAMLGWTPDPWGVVIEDLAILPRVAVVPHASAARGYVPADETLTYLNSHPSSIGIVIDEDTALVLQGSHAEVIGAGAVSIIDPSKDHQKPYAVLRAGQSRDLSR